MCIRDSKFALTAIPAQSAVIKYDMPIGNATREIRPGEFVHTLGDAHIYLNHIEQVDLQLARTPRPLPVMKINPDVKSVFDFRYEDFTLEGYDPWPAIKAPMSF